MSRFAAHCHEQAEACAELGSPFTARLCRLLGARVTDDHAVGARLLAWEDLRADAVALRIAGGLHALKLAAPEGALAGAYPPNEASDETLWQAVSFALHNEQDFLLNWLNSAPQTNEIRRCCGLIPGFHWLAARYGLPLRMSEIGASAGLNMNWDQYGLHIDGQVWGDAASPVQLSPDWRGVLPPRPGVEITDKAGCDLKPINPQNPESRARLHAYIWPDQPRRHEITRRALDMAKAPPEQEDALAFLARRLGEPAMGVLHVIYHSIVWQYLPKVAQARGRALIEAAGARATGRAPLAWLSIEADRQQNGAAICCTTWPGGETHHLGRMDFHGRWVIWQAQ